MIGQNVLGAGSISTPWAQELHPRIHLGLRDASEIVTDALVAYTIWGFKLPSDHLI